MQPIANLFGQRVAPPKQLRRSERGDLIEYFMTEANADRDGAKFKKLPLSYYAFKLSHINVKDLYYLKSVCEDARRRGNSWSKTFWWQIRPTEELPADKSHKRR